MKLARLASLKLKSLIWVEPLKYTERKFTLWTKIFLPNCPTMKIANFWQERDYLTVRVSFEEAFKDKNNGTRIF